MNSDITASDIEEQITGCCVIVLEETASTNQATSELIRKGHRYPLAVVAKRQTLGRGQQGKNWWSGDGSLTMTLAIPKQDDLPDGLISILVANVVADLLEPLVPGLMPQVKWPNDLFLDHKKVAGILIESLAIANQDDVLIIGIGVNLNCQMSQAPEEIRQLATSVWEHSTHSTNMSRFAAELIQHLLGGFLTGPRERILPQYRSRLIFGDGDRLILELRNGRNIEGHFVGIGDNGELLITSNGEQLAITSASIIDYGI